MAKSTITPRSDLTLFLGFILVVLAMPIWLQPFGAAYPDLMQKFWILRKLLHDMDESQAIEFLLDKIRQTKNNAEFFDLMKKGS